MSQTSRKPTDADIIDVIATSDDPGYPIAFAFQFGMVAALTAWGLVYGVRHFELSVSGVLFVLVMLALTAGVGYLTLTQALRARFLLRKRREIRRLHAQWQLPSSPR